MYKIFKSFNIVHRKILINKIREKKSEMRSCFQCINVNVRCIAHRSFNRCAVCIEKNVSCDLIVIEKNWKKLNKQRNYVRFEIAKRRKLMFQTQRKFEKLKILEEEFRIKVFAMIARKIHNFE